MPHTLSLRKIVKSVAKMCTHAVIGGDAGMKKLEQIDARPDIVKLDEDGLLQLIKTLPAVKVLSLPFETAQTSG